ncbi:MAG TPA: acyltransferase family protein [Treponemataceae bacterium]|nr:acyltransferase family protein [Treponemataceae bacterium]
MSYVIYALLAGLILWGMKFAGAKGFHEDFISLEVVKCLQGVCAICVMLHHISQTTAFREAGELTLFPEIGFLFVGVFFFCSGFGLIKSLKTKPGYLASFARKRLPTVLIPFYTMTAAFAAYYVATGVAMPPERWALSAIGLVLMNIQAWYIVVISLLYVAFYLIFSRVKSERLAFGIMGLFVLAQIALFPFWGHIAWWAGDPGWWRSPTGYATAAWWMQPATLWFQGEWWVNSTILFFFGMLFARFERPVVEWMRRRYWLKLAVAAAAFVGFYSLAKYVGARLTYWTEFGPSASLGFADKAICLAAQIPEVTSFVFLLFIAMMKARSINPVTKFLGAIALEIYLMHNALLTQFASLISSDPSAGPRAAPIIAADRSNLALFAAAVVLGGIALGAVFRVINRKLISLATK